MKTRLRTTLLLCVFLLSGCGVTNYPSFNAMPAEYQALIPQSFLSIRRGMNREEVRSLMGEPDITTIAADAWLPVETQKYNQLKALYINRGAVQAFWLSFDHKAQFFLFR